MGRGYTTPVNAAGIILNQPSMAGRIPMKIHRLSAIVLAGTMLCGTASAFAQNDSGTKQDMKNAGSETKYAAKDTGRGVKQGTKKVYHKTKRGTHKVAHTVSDKTSSNPQ